MRLLHCNVNPAAPFGRVLPKETGLDGLTHQGRALQILGVYGLGLPPASVAGWYPILPRMPKDPMSISFRPDLPLSATECRAVLAPSGRLRAGINLSNFLLVSARTADGGPAGVSPAMAAAIAENLGLEIDYVTYPNPGALADDAGADRWDIALIGAEPQRAEVIGFTPAYAEIEATYLVPEGSPIQSLDDVDRPGIRIAVADRTAYGLWLDRNIRHASLHRVAGLDASLALFRDEKLDVLAGLVPRLLSDVETMPGARLLPGRFMSVQQALGVPKAKAAALPWLEAFVAAARHEGHVARLIRHFGVKGLNVA